MNFSEYVKENKLFLTNVRVDINQLISFLQENKNITELSLENCHIGDEGAKALADGNLTNLTLLDLNSNRIGEEGAKAFATGNLTNLDRLCLTGDNFGGKEAKAFAESEEYCELIDKFFYIMNGRHNISFCRDLKGLWSQAREESNGNVSKLDKKVVKDFFFYLVQHHVLKEVIELFLDDFDKYPFNINSRNEYGHTLAHFYTHDPEIQKFFFERGMIPEKEMNQEREDKHIAQDNQSVHASPIVKRTKFLTKKLVEFTKDNEEELKQAVSYYVESIERLKQYQNDPVRLGLLNLTDNEKRSVMEVTLDNNPVPDDKEFIKIVIDTAKDALETKFLRKNKRGEYDEGYPTSRIKYGNNEEITIPESIGRIKLLIDNLSIPSKEKKELLVTLMEQNPELVGKKLSAIRKELGNSDILNKEQFERKELYTLLNSIDDSEKIDRLFKEISGLDIEKIWREQKELVPLKQIYIAATTYGEGSSACIQGTWIQIINSINEISTEILAQYDDYLQEEQKLEAQKNVITEENIKPFIEDLANKLIEYVELHPELKDTLEDFAVNIVDIDEPEEITCEQQKILAEINKYFNENIKNVLQNYDRNIPNRNEYDLVIKGLSEVGIMQHFAQPNQEQSNAEDNSNNYATISTDEEFQDAADQELFKLQTGEMETQIDISKTSMDLFTRGESNSRTTDAITNFSTAKMPALEQESDKNEQATTQLTGYVIQEDFIQVLQPKSSASIGDSNIQFVGEITPVLKVNADRTLHHAAEIGDKEEVKALIEIEEDINSRDKYGRTPLHYAASKGHTEILRSLLDAGAKFDEKDNVEMTPLCLAIVNGHKEVVETLVENKANVNVVSKSGKTPLDWLSISRHTSDDLCSSNCSHTEIKEILLKNGAVQGHVISSDDEYEQDEQKKLSDSNLSEIQLYAKPITIETPFVASKDPDQVSDTQGNSKQSSDPNQNNPALQNMKRSKLPVIAASVIIIPGVALGVAIAVHLEMLAVGIAVGVCCLVVAGIAYRLNRPVSAFEGNNIQELPNNALVPYKRTKDVAGSIACGVLRPSDNECLDKSQKPVVNSPKSQNRVQSQISDQEPKITIPQHLAEENLKESVSKADTNVKLIENSLKPNVVQQSTKIGNYFEFTDNELLFVITNKNYTFLEAQCKNKDIPEEFRVFVECKSGKFIITGSYNSQQNVGDEKKSVSITSVKKWKNMGLSGDPRSRLEMMNKLELYEIGKFLEVTEISDKSLITPKMKQSHTTSNPQMVNNTTIDQPTSSAVTNEHKGTLVNAHEEKDEHNNAASNRKVQPVEVDAEVKISMGDLLSEVSAQDSDKVEKTPISKRSERESFTSDSSEEEFYDAEDKQLSSITSDDDTLEFQDAIDDGITQPRLINSDMVVEQSRNQTPSAVLNKSQGNNIVINGIFIPEGAKLKCFPELSNFLSKASLEREKLFCKVVPSSLLFQSRKERIAINSQSVDAQ
ncbi:TomO hydrophobic C-terminal domain-containing protein [Wolbachia endosymbiont of Nilaparvata lugens]|uniref:TomO hydrophobic C-terminal domain-containing protein n=1 Tax=Wolbachia endosymbiont of Nilaparvata lugens TaxID=357143 RepID=UPI00117EED1A|nr:ankyrin repeat domain-containing protein [Wolbachia endosymbiont of Nilaparvata lugens]